MEMDLRGGRVAPWSEDARDGEKDVVSEEEWIEVKGIIKDGVKREVGVDGEEVQEHVERAWTKLFDCVRFTHGSASCLLVLRKDQIAIDG